MNILFALKDHKIDLITKTPLALGLENNSVIDRRLLCDHQIMRNRKGLAKSFILDGD